MRLYAGKGRLLSESKTDIIWDLGSYTVQIMSDSPAFHLSASMVHKVRHLEDVKSLVETVKRIDKKYGSLYTGYKTEEVFNEMLKAKFMLSKSATEGNKAVNSIFRNASFGLRITPWEAENVYNHLPPTPATDPSLISDSLQKAIATYIHQKETEYDSVSNLKRHGKLSYKKYYITIQTLENRFPVYSEEQIIRALVSLYTERVVCLYDKKPRFYPIDPVSKKNIIVDI